MSLSFRRLDKLDLQAVSAIDAMATDFPWSLNQFIDSFEADHCTVILLEGKTIGFAVFQQVLDEITLLNVAVDPACQGKGYAKRLLQSQLARFSDGGVRQCFLEVRISNLRAIKLYESLGFVVVGERKNYYPMTNGRENALVMSKPLVKSHEEKS